MTFTIIGTGFIFPAHAEAIRSVGGKIIDIVNTAHGDDTWRNVIKTTTSDCVVVLSPNDLHYPMIQAAVDAGKIVLSEKPLTLHVSETRNLLSKSGVFTVLQLRHHPLVKELETSLDPKKKYDVVMDISVYRDEHYYAGWKGQPQRSGGVLLNLGSHYFDLLVHLFGKPDTITVTTRNEKTVSGILDGSRYRCQFTVSTDAPRDNQRRTYAINGMPYNFSSLDNLSFENLHRLVYHDLLAGKGVTPRDVLPSMELINDITRAGEMR